MATVPQQSNESSTTLNLLPLIVFGVLSLVFGFVTWLVIPSLGVLPPQASVEAVRTDGLFRVLIGIGGVVFFLVQGLIYYAAYAFRARAGDTSDGPNIHGNTLLEIVWTVVPSLIVVFLAIYAFAVWRSNTEVSETPNVLNGDSIVMNAVGQRFAWSFTYFTNEFQQTEDGEQGNRIVLTDSNLYVYAGQEVELQMETIDVIHSFWVPAMRVKQDLLPGRVTSVRFTPRDPETGWESVSVLNPITVYASQSPTSDVIYDAPAPAEGEFQMPIHFDLVNPDVDLENVSWVEVVNPNNNNETGYIAADAVLGKFNSYRLICTELCGGGHGEMYTNLYLFDSQESLEQSWYNPMVEANSVPAGNPIEHGARVIDAYGCSGCHMLDAFPSWAGASGPNQTGLALSVANRAAQVDGVETGAEYIAQSIRYPDEYIAPPGGWAVNMRQYLPDEMSQEDLNGIVAFLCARSVDNPADSTCGLENWEFDADGNFTGDVDALVDELTAVTDEYE